MPHGTVRSQSPARMLPGDDSVVQALHDAERYAPSSGPMLH
ncbi:hypothetical protein QPK29_008800 [Massilia sp. YIM B02787]|uniref:Uncharacterized protein n=1 Tax=Massilia orientalis TaxID=3050128 RepID=A0ACC7M8D9_9BURK|nr:hypothetical protein [Massilia sp. YIM B02787]